MVTTRSASARLSRSRSGTPVAPGTTTSTPARADIDDVSRSRTIQHMNKDHAEDMSAILRHYSGLSATQAAGAEMLDLDLNTMTIRSASGEHHRVPVVPPMGDWKDRRARLVDMTVEARRALGLEVVVEEPGHVPGSGSGSGSGSGPGPGPGPGAPGPTATRYVPPRGADWVTFAGILGYYACAALVYGGLVTPGSAAWRFLEAIRFPQGPVGFSWLVEAIFVPVVGLHLAEAFWMDRSRLQPGGVARGSSVWWLWIVDTFIEGLPAFRRWDRVIVGKGAKSN